MDYAKKLSYCNGIAAVQKDDKWGFVDKDDKVVIAFEYDELYQYHEDGVWFFNDRINISKGDKWGFINSQGKAVIPFIYDYAHPFENGLATVIHSNRELVIDKYGEIVFKNCANYSNVSAIDNSLFIISSSTPNSYGIVDRNEKVLVPLTYSCKEIHTIKGSYELSVNIKKSCANHNPNCDCDIDEHFSCHIQNGEVDTTWECCLVYDEYPALKDIPICYMMHHLLDHNNYAMQDILRVKSVVNEIKITYTDETQDY